ncbi:shikimate kinase [Sediminibacter sp. Hel_I_10]|uniref:shikimate kinase n=1 Tax=Sediminibacter sp. Hel_I_10 TaxID=1392490 RepID=UPI00047C6E1A|nr:shikimate kinase [Sediminibacter sp. Hel_I_10]
MTIVLLGYMGSGKSSVGQCLADKISFDFIDFDIFLSEKEGISIPFLFEKKGEIYFRKLEANYLYELLNRKNTIISLGGGTPCYGNNMATINKSDMVTSIYLKAAIPTLIERLYNERKKRPMISHLDNLDEFQEFIGKHLFERSQFYLQSDFSVVTDHKTPDQIAEDIITLLF